MYPCDISLPDPLFRDLPPFYNTEHKRRLVAEEMLYERVDQALEAFYEAMN